MTDERRKHSRVPVLFDVIWEGATGRYEARTSDLSMGGCFVDTIGQASTGETINFKLRLPSGGWLELRGEVTYEFPSMGFGVHFTTASDADWKRLEWLLKAEVYKTEK
jgi:hypothetical protein